MMSDQEAYVGLWTNYRKGAVLGSTLTVKDEYGAILVAFLALLVGWAGGHVWGIICFVVHQTRTGGFERDGLLLQQQAILRNRQTESSTFCRLLEIGWAWRSRTKGAIWRTMPLAILAAVNLIGFVTAGIFSSQVMRQDGELLTVGTCGFLDEGLAKPWNQWTEKDWKGGDALFVAAYNGWREASSYTRSCYSDYLVKGQSSCQKYAIPRIESNIVRNATCPFRDGICTEPAIVLDTGFIDSDLHLGINARSQHRLQMRKVSSCAPIRIEGRFETNWTSAPALRPGTEMFYPAMVPNDAYKYYDFGDSTLYGYHISNFTFIVRNSSITTTTRPYTLLWRTAYAGNETMSGFEPIPSLKRSDADVSLLMLNNKVAYTGEVKDPWFRASIRGVSPSGLQEAWMPSNTLSGVACTEQWQLCNGRKCGPLSGINEYKQSPPAMLELNPLQTATYRTLWQFAQPSKIDVVMQFIIDEVLLAQQLVYGSFGISSPLPEHHWQKEMENIHNVTLAMLQGGGNAHIWSEQLKNNPGINFTQFLKPEIGPEAQVICQNHKMRNSKYASFNMFGVMMIIVLSLLVIVLNLCLADLVGWIQGRGGRTVANDEWIEDNLLHMQRVVLQSRGIGPWEDGGVQEVPVMAGYDVKIPRDVMYSQSATTSEVFDGLMLRKMPESVSEKGI